MKSHQPLTLRLRPEFKRSRISMEKDGYPLKVPKIRRSKGEESYRRWCVVDLTSLIAAYWRWTTKAPFSCKLRIRGEDNRVVDDEEWSYSLRKLVSLFFTFSRFFFAVFFSLLAIMFLSKPPLLFSFFDMGFCKSSFFCYMVLQIWRGFRRGEVALWREGSLKIGGRLEWKFEGRFHSRWLLVMEYDVVNCWLMVEMMDSIGGYNLSSHEKKLQVSLFGYIESDDGFWPLGT